MNFYSIRIVRQDEGGWQIDAAVFPHWRSHGLLEAFEAQGHPQTVEKIRALDTLTGRTFINCTSDELETTMFEIWRLPDFTAKKIFYDNLSKELVRVTNSRCLLDHSSHETYSVDHKRWNNQCLYVPSLVHVHRVQYEPKTEDFVIHMAYRTVNPAYLRLPKVELPENLLMSVPRMRGIVVGFPYSTL
jgi:hypothetical protein